MIKRIVMLFILIGTLQAEAQFMFDARTKSILDLYYLKKGSGTITSTNILDGTIQTNDLDSIILSAIFNQRLPIGTGIWGVRQDGVLIILPTFLARHSGCWRVISNSVVIPELSLMEDSLWTTNALGQIVTRTP